MSEVERFSAEELADVRQLSEENLNWYIGVNDMERKFLRITRAGIKIATFGMVGISAVSVATDFIYQRAGETTVKTTIATGLAGLAAWAVDRFSNNTLNGRNHEVRLLLGQEATRRTEERYGELVNDIIAEIEVQAGPYETPQADTSQLQLFSETD